MAFWKNLRQERNSILRWKLESNSLILGSPLNKVLNIKKKTFVPNDMKDISLLITKEFDFNHTPEVLLIN